MMREKRSYAVTAATGRIGGRVARGLLAAGHVVHALGRDPVRLDELAMLGAIPYVGDLRDPQFVESAFGGVDAAFLLVPGNRGARDFRRYFGDVGANYAGALRAASVRSAVFISALGAHDEKYRGLILVHRDVELSLSEVDALNVVLLRAPAFFENLIYFLPAMHDRATLATPIAPDAPLEMASTHDIAAVTLSFLTELAFDDKRAVELHGPQGLTMRRISRMIANELGCPFAVEPRRRTSQGRARVSSYWVAAKVAAILPSTGWDIVSRDR